MKEKTKFPIAVVFGFIGLILLYLPTAGLGKFIDFEQL